MSFVAGELRSLILGRERGENGDMGEEHKQNVKIVRFFFFFFLLSTAMRSCGFRGRPELA